MRICLNPGPLGSGGIGLFAISLGEALGSMDVEVDYFLTDASGPRMNMIPDQANVFEGRGRALYSLPGFVRYLHSRNPNVVISARDPMNVMALLAKDVARAQCQMICCIQTNVSKDVAGSNRRIRLYSRITRKLLRRADVLVGVSNGVARDAERWLGLSQGCIQTIYNPAWSDTLASQISSPVEHPWLLETKKIPTIISIGRLTKQKDFPTLFKAFAHLTRKTQMRLIVLGEGDERHELSKLGNELGIQENLSMPGHVSSPISYLSRADLFVLSSAWEGFGNVIVEALGTGTPVVATNCPSGPSEILDGGRFGRLVPVGNYIALAEAIHAELTNPTAAEILQERATEFHSARIARQYLGLVNVDTAKGIETK